MADEGPRRRAAEEVSGRVAQVHAPVLEVRRTRWSRARRETVEVPLAHAAAFSGAHHHGRYLQWAQRNGGLLLDEVALGTAIWLRTDGTWQLCHTSGCVRGEDELPVPTADLRQVHLDGRRLERRFSQPAGGPWRVVLVPLPESAVAALWMDRDDASVAPLIEAAPAWSALPVGALSPEAAALARLVDQLPGARTAGDLAVRAALRGRIERLGWRLRALSGGPFEKLGDGRSLDEQLEDLRLLVQRRVPEGITLDWRVPAGLGRPLLTCALLRSMVLELVDNAARALGQGGTRLRLRAGEMQLETAESWRAATLAAGTWLWVEVADDGPGIAESLGDPFHAGVGTAEDELAAGLGLTAVEAAVELLGGGVRLRTAEGRGTIVQLALPTEPPGA